jgi:outer membrane biosynthesis protein TonB
MATQTPASKARTGGPVAPKSRILRIGIVQGGRIIEERLVRKRENISVGWSSKATFAVPSEALPKQWMLFEAHPKGYIAHFADAMDARIAVGNEVISLAQLRQAGRLRKSGTSSRYLLDERSRGKVTVGDLSILFQFVTPPPPQPRPQLPASVRGSFFTGMDWFYTSIATASFLAHLVFVLYLRGVDWPRKPDIEEIPDRFVQMVIKAKPPEPVKDNAKKDETKKEEDAGKKEEKRPAANAAASKTPKKEISAEEKARLDAERRARLAEQVRNTGILKLLGAKADGSGSIADVLGKGDVDRDQEKAFQGVGGLAVATSDASLRGVKTGTGGSGKVANISGLRGAGSIAGGDTGAGSTEKRVTGVVKNEAPSVDGELDPSLVSKEVRARMGAIKACYERSLKRNPNLSGKIKVRWTITAAGTVSGVEIEDDSMGDGEVSSCIKGLVSRWRFPAPSGGSVEVVFPFVFQSSQ